MNRIVTTAILLLFLGGCAKSDKDILGSWVEPVPGQPGNVQGIHFEADGTASSINMRTLQYNSWKMDEGKIILDGLSIGNGQTISFSDTLFIAKMQKDTLVLQRGNHAFVYTRPEEEN
ncbi:Lipocalin-like [Mariniphaga anaerophila]|uniref:Lipocalin-like n=1 Tax=Mariniphaga anaerophila TaxID=1484053 RepID=A0A1M4ZWH9_9BACT|nr:lipocalin family protein [Mariniphaga anaerophila]SHF22378.1 Lipocalin-like [Mariniphaga anaerophila]